MYKNNLPSFKVLDTESSHGRYSKQAKEISFEDLVKFHGHACDGLYRGVYALSVALGDLFRGAIIDRTDLRSISRNSPCLGDAASYLTGTRVRFGTQDVREQAGVWYIVQRISTGETVEVKEDPGFFNKEILQAESDLNSANSDELPQKLNALKALQDEWIEKTLLKTRPEEHYHSTRIEYKWIEVPYTNKGIRTDIIFKNVIE